MAQYTSNIGLHQWEPSDHFLRTDFNQDFAKIDAGFSWLEGALARSGYETLQVRLAAQLEGKTIPAGRCVLFDCLKDKSGISLSGACVLDSQRGGVMLDTGPGLTNFEYNFGTNEYTYLSSTNESNRAERGFTANGSGTLRSIVVNLSGAGASMSVTDNSGRQLWTSSEITCTDTVKAYTFYPNLALQGGVYYKIYVYRKGDRLRVYGNSGGFGYRCTCSSSTGNSGSIATVARTVEPFRMGRIWVRHTGGTVGCSIQRGTGIPYETLTAAGTRAGVDVRGTACSETEFLIPLGEEQSGPVRLSISMQSQEDARVCDYGAVLI